MVTDITYYYAIVAQINYSNLLLGQPQYIRRQTEIRKLLLGSTPGYDDFCVSILKYNIDSLINPLKHIINLSISTGTFPDKLKIAKAIPLHKADIKSNLNNRPISLLSVVSKVLEKCVNIQSQTYLEDNELLAEQQFGFSKGKNTLDALF